MADAQIPITLRVFDALPGCSTEAVTVNIWPFGEQTAFKVHVHDDVLPMIAEMMGCRPHHVQAEIAHRYTNRIRMFTAEIRKDLETEDMAKAKTAMGADARPRIWMREYRGIIQFRCHPTAVWRECEDMHTAMLVALGGDEKADAVIFWETRHVD